MDDYLKECLEEVRAKARVAVPLDDFHREFCRVCQNRGCTRSGASNTSFDKRVLNWEKRLFDEVPRARDDDSAYENLRSKRFLAPVRSSWDSPTAAAAPAPRPWAAPPAPSSKTEAPVEKAPEEAPVATEKPPEAIAAPAPAPLPKAAGKPIPAGNVPFDSDGWTDEGPATRDTVVKPGGTFTFGGGK